MAVVLVIHDCGCRHGSIKVINAALKYHNQSLPAWFIDYNHEYCFVTLKVNKINCLNVSQTLNMYLNVQVSKLTNSPHISGHDLWSFNKITDWMSLMSSHLADSPVSSSWSSSRTWCWKICSWTLHNERFIFSLRVTM